MNITKWNGEPISTPGAYSNVGMASYHGRLVDGDSASRSQLWKIVDKSPAHLWIGHYANPDREPEAPNDAKRFGRAAHHLLLGEDDFHETFALQPDTYPEGADYPAMIGNEKPWHNGAKWCRAWRAATEATGREVITAKELETVRRMAGGLNGHPLVRAGILNGLIETTMAARHPKTGIWLKIRPDAIPTDGPDIGDLKTIADISDEGIEKAIGDSGLFMQGAMTRMVYDLLGMEFASFSMIFAEKTAPYCVRVKTLTDGDLDTGTQAVETALRVYARCLASGTAWPGPGGTQTDAEFSQMTPWKRGQIERRLQALEKEMSL